MALPITSSALVPPSPERAFCALRFAAHRPLDRWLVGALWLEGTLLLVVGLLPDLRFAAERPIDRWLVGALWLEGTPLLVQDGFPTRFAAERPIDRWFVGALWLEGTLSCFVGWPPDLRFAAERPIDRWQVRHGLKARYCL